MTRLRKAEIGLAIVVTAAVGCRTAMPPAPHRVPDPLELPKGVAPLSEAAAVAARATLVAAERHDQATAAEKLKALPAGHPVTALVRLEVSFLAGQGVSESAWSFAETAPPWEAAWLLASLSAERDGQLIKALEAARRAAALAPQGRGSERARELEAQVVSTTVNAARDSLARGEAAVALRQAAAVLEFVPDAPGLRSLAVSAALATGDPGQAAMLVTALPDNAQGLELKGKVAEALGQWELAAELYGRLPAGAPGRCELIAGAQRHLRLANAPPYVSMALSSPVLNRRGLAAILMWEVPDLAAKAAGGVPVFEDVVNSAERTDIVTLVRAGVLTGDTVARRFSPSRPVAARELAATLERLAGVLGRRAPTWCETPVGGSGHDCLVLPLTPGGAETAELVRRVAVEGGECR